MTRDPFDEVKRDVSQSLRSVEELLVTFQKTRDTLIERRLVRELQQIEDDLNALKDAIRQVEANRKKFPITDVELDSRRAFVRSSMATVAVARTEVVSKRPSCSGDGLIAGAGDAEKDNLLARHVPSRKGRLQNEADARNEEYIDAHMSQQQMQMVEQEEVLDDLHGAVGRLKHMSGTMNEELTQQVQIISDLESQVDSTASSLNELKNKLKQLMPKHERGKLMIIFFLTVVLIILCILVVET